MKNFWSLLAAAATATAVSSHNSWDTSRSSDPQTQEIFTGALSAVDVPQGFASRREFVREAVSAALEWDDMRQHSYHLTLPLDGHIDNALQLSELEFGYWKDRTGTRVVLKNVSGAELSILDEQSNGTVDSYKWWNNQPSDTFGTYQATTTTSDPNTIDQFYSKALLRFLEFTDHQAREAK